VEEIVKFLDDTKKKEQGKYHPVAFMCVEKDFTKCHRHRLAKKLEEVKGLKSRNLS
jgi:hypothetical protein